MAAYRPFRISTLYISSPSVEVLSSKRSYPSSTRRIENTNVPNCTVTYVLHVTNGQRCPTLKRNNSRHTTNSGHVCQTETTTQMYGSTRLILGGKFDLQSPVTKQTASDLSISNICYC